MLRSGRWPTVEGIRKVLGGGSPNSVAAYINEWYRELGSGLASAETPLAGFPPEAVSQMTEFWRLAAVNQNGVRDKEAAEDTATRMLVAERDALEAESKSLETLYQELQRHRSTAEKSLAEACILFSRREAALEEERSPAASLEQALAQARMELEVQAEPQRLAQTRATVPPITRELKRPKRPLGHITKARRKIGAKGRTAKDSASTRPAKRALPRAKPRSRR